MTSDFFAIPRGLVLILAIAIVGVLASALPPHGVERGEGGVLESSAAVFADGPLLPLSAGLAISALAVAATHARRRGSRRAETRSEDTTSRRAEAASRDAAEIDRLRQSLDAWTSERTALQRAVEELETMNAMVSHDLRSPLGAVINFAAILAEDYGQVLDSPAQDCLRRITSSATNAVSLLDGLLTFSHSGREELHRTSLDMRRVVESVRDDLIGRASARGSFEIADLPPAYADAAMIRRVYTNLISNALKFVDPGDAPRVEIGWVRDAEEPVYFVRDRGVGFDMASVDQLFQVFGRLHRGTFEGHGIGLSIVARLVRRHGGRVWAQSAKGKGATFLFSLPPASTGELEARGFLPRSSVDPGIPRVSHSQLA